MKSSAWLSVAAIAELLVYPSQRTAPLVVHCREALGEHEGDQLAGVAKTLELLESAPLHELEELYTQTFDLSPLCTLEVGWHLYGEQYERGRFLVRTRELLEEVGLSEGGELPDFLPSLLRALPRMDEPRALELSAECVLPAVQKMCEALDGKSNAYEPLLRATRDLLEAQVPEGAARSTEERYRPHLKGRKQDGWQPPRGTGPAQPGLVPLGNGGGRHG